VSNASVEQLRTIDLFDDLGDDELDELTRLTTLFDVAAGGVIAEQGKSTPGLLLLFEGVAQALIVEGERTEPAGRHLAPTWMGAISVLTGGLLGVRMQAATDCHMARIGPDDFRRLAFAQPAVHQRVMAQVAPVMSRVTAIEQNRERLTALGTMAAGLAHELNNPAAAAQRAAVQMAEAITTVSSTIARFVESGIERDGAAVLVALQQEALERASARTPLDALDAADAEDDLLDALEQHEIPRAWALAEPLASAGLDRDWVERVVAAARGASDAALGWVAATLTARSLAAELQESTRRMSGLVSAVKSYAYMDRGELVEVDVHEGLETTLTILGHRLKHTAIEVERDYARDLPRLTVRGSELNQVWTNLLDNAIDALGERGTITIATRRDGDWVEVDVSDDGPGIPEELRERVLEPFFTTKEVGRGTGLGLATVRGIIVDRHAGSVTIESRPGATKVRVRLPLGGD
jgi:signal transduction histidine kinase